MNAYEKIRAALEQAYKERHEPCSVELRIDEALAALAELENAAAPQFVAGEVTDEICERVFDRAYGLQSECGEDTSAHEESNAWLTAWQRELGPALGLAEIREPTPEECEEIERLWSRTLDSVSETQEVRPETCGRAMFYAVRAVLWPKEGCNG